MRIHLIKEPTVVDYANAHKGSKIPLEAWLEKVKTMEWETAADIPKTFGNADLLGRSSNRIVFNIGGNNYRMICKYAFGIKRKKEGSKKRDEIHLWVCWIGTHREYDALSKGGQQYTIKMY